MPVLLVSSGSDARGVVEALQRCLTAVLEGVDVIRFDDIVPAPARLDDPGSLALVVVSDANRLDPGLHFSAGALVRALGPGAVVPVLVGLSSTELPAPLCALPARVLDRAGLHELVRIVDTRIGCSRPEPALTRALDTAWPEIEPAVTAAGNRCRRERPATRSSRETFWRSA